MTKWLSQSSVQDHHAGVLCCIYRVRATPVEAEEQEVSALGRDVFWDRGRPLAAGYVEQS